MEMFLAILFSRKNSVLVGPVLLIPVAIGVREVQQSRAMQKTNECATLVSSNCEVHPTRVTLGLNLDIVMEKVFLLSKF